MRESLASRHADRPSFVGPVIAMSSPDDNNDAPLSWLELIPEDYLYTRTFEDGSETTMNMGQDIKMWTHAANETRASDARTRARWYLNGIREASIREIEKVLDEAGDSDDDRLLKENCRALLKKIPAPYVEEETKVKLKPEEDDDQQLTGIGATGKSREEGDGA